MKILFIGAGNMAQAIISGITKNKVVSPQDIFIYEINKATREKAVDSFKINLLNEFDKNMPKFDVLILAVKPQVFLEFNSDEKIKALIKIIDKNTAIVSIMAGIKISKIADFFGSDKSIIRVMPNTPALVLQAMSVLSKSDNTNDIQMDNIKMIFESIGKTEIMDEKYLDAVTALSGSGPAYVFTFIEALTQGGVLCGLSKQIAQNLAVQTLIGSCYMISDSTIVEDLRHKVTSPAGTTIEGLSVLEKNGFRSGIIEAVRAAYNRSKELSGK